MINFSVRDIRAAERHLGTLGVRRVRPAEKTGSAWFSTVEDPAGNQFIQLPQAPNAQIRARS